MNHSEVLHLIGNGVIQSALPETWADLGCGSGTFTLALADLLAAGSKIIGIDNSMQNLPKSVNNVEIRFQKADFENDELLLPPLDGIMMANSLHYVKDKISFIRKIEQSLKTQKVFLIVEYNTLKPNHWVPYPISFSNLVELFSGLNYLRIDKLAEVKSNYGGAMYSAIVQY